MNKYYTLIFVPEKGKKTYTFNIPTAVLRFVSVTLAGLILVCGVFAYDYWKVIQQIYENKYLTLENRQLKEQIQIFQMKINTISEDLRRLNTFEKKLRIMTGLEQLPTMTTYNQLNVDNEFHFMDPATHPMYSGLKTDYEKKIAKNLGFKQGYQLAKGWSTITGNSFQMAEDFASFDVKFEQVHDVLALMEERIHLLDQSLLDKQSFLLSTPTLQPAKGWITSYFGQRISPYSGGMKMHEGVDVAAPYGTTIVAPADGIVVFSGIKSGFGKFVQIDHGYGMETLYAHSQDLFVHSGDRIKRGERIAAVGNTGHSTGPHLHYEVRVNGIAVDPLFFILD